MSLLRDIQDAAIDSNVSLATLLRKCKVLAARLGNDVFKQWVENELSGYKGQSGLPEYRSFSVGSKGHFVGAFGRALKNADMLMYQIPDEYRVHLEVWHMCDSVAALEALVKDSDGDTAMVPWPSQAAVTLGSEMYSGLQCLQAWKVIPINKVVGILDIIRTKVLNFALEIETENPDVGEAPVNSNPVSQDKVQQVFNTYITGNVQNVATGSHQFSQNATYNESNDELFSQLLDALHGIKDSKAASDMTVLVEEMRASQGKAGFKEHYQKFVSLLADHMQILGPVVTPFLPALTSLIS